MLGGCRTWDHIGRNVQAWGPGPPWPTCLVLHLAHLPGTHLAHWPRALLAHLANLAHMAHWHYWPTCLGPTWPGAHLAWGPPGLGFLAHWPGSPWLTGPGPSPVWSTGLSWSGLGLGRHDLPVSHL